MTGARMKWRWAIRSLNPRLATDKKAIDHMRAGVGYYFVKEINPYGGKPVFVVGYKHFGGPLKPGSEWASSSQARTLDKLDALRYPQHDEKDEPQNAV